MARELEPPHDQKLDQVPKVKTRRRGVKTAVEGDLAGVEQFLEFSGISGDVDESSPDELFPQSAERPVVLGDGEIPGRRLGHGVRLSAGLGQPGISGLDARAGDRFDVGAPKEIIS